MCYLDQILDLPRPIIKIIIQNYLLQINDYEKLCMYILNNFDFGYSEEIVSFLNDLHISKKCRDKLNNLIKSHYNHISIKGVVTISIEDIENNPSLISKMNYNDIDSKVIIAFKRKVNLETLNYYLFDMNELNLDAKKFIIKCKPDMIKYFKLNLDFFKQAYSWNKEVLKTNCIVSTEIKKFILEKETIQLRILLKEKEKLILELKN